MSDKKHIDRLFQEKLKNFEEVPSDVIWDNIHDRLHEDKRKRRVIPLWWKLTGVAALLALLFTVGIQLMSNDANSDLTNPTVDTEKRLPNKSNNGPSGHKNKLDGIQNQIDKSSNVVVENELNHEDFSTDTSEEVSKETSKENPLNQNMTSISKTDKNSIVGIDKSDSKKGESKNKLNKDVALKGSVNEYKNSDTKDVVTEVSNTDENNSNQKNIDNKIDKSEVDKFIKDSKNDQDSQVTNASEKLESIISEEKKEDTKKDQSIENAIAEANTEDEKEKEKKLSRWNISPNVAPVYFNTLGKGSSLDEQFVDNSNSSEVTISYGFGGSYAVNDRLKLRAGINKVDMNYNTNNVIAFSSIDAASSGGNQIANINLTSDSENMTYLSAQSLNNAITPEIINTRAEGSINQRFGFIEVPLEVEYALVNKKLGVNVIGGFSTLFVDNNDIYSVLDGNQTRIGEANNINNMSYSANIGLGVNYNISEKIKVNVEPTFKYQINTFNNSSGDFRPYFIGLYTGLSYKF